VSRLRRRRTPLAARLSRDALTVNKGGATLLGIGLVDSIGTGLYIAGSAVFFTRVVGLSAAEVGIGLSVAGLLGLVAQPAIGWAADRWGARRVLVLLNLWRAAGFTAYAFTGSFESFIVVAALLGVGEQAVFPVFQALAEQVVGPARRVAMMARVRVVYNVGYTLGALLASAAVASGTRSAFEAIMLGNALTFVIAAALLPRVRLLPAAELTGDAPSAAAGPGRLRLRALRDGRYMAVAAVNGILALHMTLLVVAVPLWVTLHTTAPPALVGLLLVLNTTLAVALQVRVARSSDALAGGVRALRRGAIALALSCGAFAAAPLTNTTGLVVATLLLGVLALTAGELLQSAGGWGLSYLLAPTRSRAEYLATFNLGTSAQFVVGPMLVTVGVLDHGSLGWIALAGCFLLAGAAVGSLAAHAARRPELADEAGPSRGVEPTLRPGPPSEATA
jgi:MFS family permease